MILWHSTSLSGFLHSEVTLCRPLESVGCLGFSRTDVWIPIPNRDPAEPKHVWTRNSRGPHPHPPGLSWGEASRSWGIHPRGRSSAAGPVKHRSHKAGPTASESPIHQRLTLCQSATPRSSVTFNSAQTSLRPKNNENTRKVICPNKQ